MFFVVLPLSIMQPNHVSSPAPEGPPPGNVLIIDNYDSFTYNIREMLAKIGVDAIVKRNDEITMDEVEKLNPSHIIISPGPGTPEKPEDIGITGQVIDYAVRNRRVLLGICLGHQALAHHFGGAIVQADEILHGKTSDIHLHHQDDLPYPDLFAGLSETETVMRYHSLAAERASLPDVFRITAETRDRYQTIMAMQHQGGEGQEALPLYGVQFHPESFATPAGRTILENFLKADPEAFKRLLQRGLPSLASLTQKQNASLPAAVERAICSLKQRPFELREFPCDLPPEEVYARLHAVRCDMFCLESLAADRGVRHHRYSYFGIAPRFVLSARNEKCLLNDREVEMPEGANPLDVLDAALHRLRQDADGDVPQDQSFSGGLVGFSAYEAIQYTEPTVLPPTHLTPQNERTFSYGYFEDGLIYDNQEKTYRYFTRGDDRSELIRGALAHPTVVQDPVITKRDGGVSKAEYERMVEDVQQKVRAGETFQTVPSRRETYRIEGSMVPLYKRLRELYPSGSMHAIRIGNMESVGSFPELVIAIDHGVIISRHLAGMRKLSGDLATDEALYQELVNDRKERAEHIMLVDLGRNDVSRTALPGTVDVVPEQFMQRLDAGPVMHIASEIRGMINGLSPLRMLSSVFPMGTVSGAPKVRSMQIIASQEAGPRGLYAGSIGFLDLTGNLHAVVGLRSIMRVDDELKVQAGGGVVYDSDPASEYAETQNKMSVAHTVIRPFLKP